MRVDTALTLINEGLTYHPGWVVCAEDWTHRFEDTVRVTVYLTEARLSERENVPDFTRQVDPPGARARFLLTVGDVPTLRNWCSGWSASSHGTCRTESAIHSGSRHRLGAVTSPHDRRPGPLVEPVRR